MESLTPEELSALYRCLIEGGCPVQQQHGYKITPTGLVVEQVPEMFVNTIFDLADGGTGYLLELLIRNELDRSTYIHGFQIETPWGRARIALLPDSSKSVPRYYDYTFPGGTLGFDRSLVINSIFSGHGRLNPGDEIEGLLLGVDEEPLPDEYPDNGRVVVKLSIFDERGNRFTSKFRLCVDRSALRARERKKEILASLQPKGARKELIIGT